MIRVQKSPQNRLRIAFPVLAFFGGFLWDALTLGQTVQTWDLWILFGYLFGAALLLPYLAKRVQAKQIPPPEGKSETDPPLSEAASMRQRVAGTKIWLREGAPYFLLQFFFGGLFSALFIFYFKSSSQLSAYAVVALLALLLIANEFLEKHYGRFTITWCLFGICAILFLNFAIPYLVGSLSGVWFYTSTLAGASLTHLVRRYSAGRPGRIFPVWLLAGGMVFAYLSNMIPPVPLVKRELLVGHDLKRLPDGYRLTVEEISTWIFWREQSGIVHLVPGEALYCFSSVSAPRGFATRLFHRWVYQNPDHSWVTASHIGFTLNGGRKNGFRGYTYKKNLLPGKWAVHIETEDGRIIASHHFEIRTSSAVEPIRSTILDL